MIRKTDIATKCGYFAYTDESGKLYYLMKKHVVKTIGEQTTEIEESLFFEIYKEGRYKEALEKTIKTISLNPRTSVEIDEFLDNKKYNDVKDRIILFLKDKKFINDDIYCDLFISYHKDVKLESRFFVMQKLLKKFIKPSGNNEVKTYYKNYASAMLNRFYPRGDEKKIADELIKKMEHKNIDREMILRKLSQRGFHYSNIKRKPHNFFDEEI